MPISFDRNVLAQSFDRVFLLEPDFEFRAAVGAGGRGWC